MATRNVHLVEFRPSPRQRAHFAIFVGSAADPQKGTLIHVVGAPMAGYALEFKRNYIPTETNQPHTITLIGQTNAQNVVDSTNSQKAIENTPRCNLEMAAAQVPPPRISQNFMAPVNDLVRLPTEDAKSGQWSTSISSLVLAILDPGLLKSCNPGVTRQLMALVCSLLVEGADNLQVKGADNLQVKGADNLQAKSTDNLQVEGNDSLLAYAEAPRM